MFRLVAVSGATAVPMLSVVHAADSSSQSESRQTIKASELPLYGTPPPPELTYVEEKVTPFHENVSLVRKTVWEYLDTIQGTTDNIKGKWNTAKAHTNDLVTYMREDSGALPRAAFITVSGFGGIIAGYKGGIFRKTLYASAAMAAASSVCFPTQAVDITKQGWTKVKVQATDLWQQQTGSTQAKPKTPEPVKEKDTSVEQKAITTETKATPVVTPGESDTQTSTEKKTVVKGGEDYGQSKKEDQDMYSTRTG